MLVLAAPVPDSLRHVGNRRYVIRKRPSFDEPGEREDAMNQRQKITLLTGTILLVLAIWTAPRIQRTPDGVIHPPDTYPELPNVRDAQAALVRGLVAAGVTGILWFAFAGKQAT